MTSIMYQLDHICVGRVMLHLIGIATPNNYESKMHLIKVINKVKLIHDLFGIIKDLELDCPKYGIFHI